MTALIRAELLKLRTRTAIGLLLAALALDALTVYVNVPAERDARPPIPLHDPRVLAGVTGVGFAVPEVVMVLLSGLVVTQEYRYGTAVATYLGEPRRRRVLIAKWTASVLASAVITCGSLAVSLSVGMTLIDARGGDATFSPRLWQIVGAGFVALAACAVIGVAVGALVRSQVIAVVGVLVWMLVVEQIMIPTCPVVGRWLPGGAIDAWLQLGPVLDLHGRLLTAPMGGLVLAGYTAAAAVLAKLTLRRDVV